MKMKNLTQRITGSLALLTALIILTPNAGAGTPFTAGNIVVERVNVTGTSGNAQPVDVMEYNTSGGVVQTISLPSAATRPSTSPYNLLDTGSSGADGGLTRSGDGGMIALPGYNGIPAETGLTSSSTATILRVIGAISLGGVADTSRGINIFSGNAFRSVVSTDGTKFWCTGANGLWYSDSIPTLNQLGTANLRMARVFNNQIFVSSGSGTPGIGVHSVAVLGNGLPASGTATYTQLITDNSGSTSPAPSPYNFEFNSTMDVCYVTDDRSVANGGGIQKYTKSGTWSLAYTLGTGASSTVGAFGLAVDWSGANPVIYATTLEAAGTGNRVIQITDAGAGSAATTIVASTVNKWFRGVALAPVSSVAIAPTALPAAGSLSTGVNDVPVFGFQLTPIGPTADFTALKLTTTGTATPSDLSNFRVVYDVNGNGTYESGTDIVISGSGQSLANPINFTAISGQLGFSAVRQYLVIANVAGGATLGHSFTGSIAAAGDATTVPAPQGTAAGNRQTIGIDMTMSAVASSESATISSLLNNPSISLNTDGAQVWQVTFNNPAGAAGAGTISAITFTQGGANGVANWQNTIQAAELFDGATPLAAGTINAANIAFSGLSVTVAEGGSKTLSLRISLKSTPGALTDNTKFQFALAATDVTASGNGVVNATPIISDPALNQITVVATRLVFSTLPTFVVVASTFTGTVQAQDANGNRDLDDTNGVTITRTSGTGILGGGSIFNLIAGLHSFTTLTYDTAETFNVTAAGGTLASATSAITAEAVATVSEVIMPQYVQGIASGSSNSKRLPFAFRVTLGNLVANANYRYYNMCVVGADAANIDGAGNCIFVTPSGNFVRTDNTGMNTAGGFGTFTSDNTGSYTGWFVSEPTGNAARFTAGTQILMRIMLNNGLGGTTVFQRVTTTTPVTVLAFGTTADAITGTGIRGNSCANGKNFVLLYNNTAGTGQPLTGTFVESDGVAEGTTGFYVSFYNTSVDGTAGAWGAIIPNNNANGVQRIEQRALSDGSLLAANTDSDGAWPSGANTVNPTTGDATPIVITASDAPLTGSTPAVPIITQIQVTGGNVLIDFTGGTCDTVADFTVLSASSLPTLAPIAATITTSGPGQFRATVPVVTPAAFYRIRRP